MIHPRKYTSEQWVKAKDEARHHLMLLAASEIHTTYSALLKHIHAIDDLNPIHQHYFRLLDEISAEEHHAGRGMLTALVCSKETGMPGDKFFQLALFLGIQFCDRNDFWISELRKVTGYWKEKCPPALLEPES